MDVTDIELPVYSEWAPTQFDTKGLGCEDQQDWLVCPVAITRDSGHLELSNWAAQENALEAVSPEPGDDESMPDTGPDFEIHRFSHWGPGWIEIVLVRPGSACHRVAQELVVALGNYPLLDEDDASEREYGAAYDRWEQCGLRERIRICAKYNVSIFAARRLDQIPDRVELSYLAEG